MSHIITKPASAVFWGGLEIFLKQGVGLVLSVVLARLLSPEEFGTIAMLSLFTGIGNVLVDCGFSSALIQRKELRPEDTSSVFYFNVVMASFVALVLVGMAPLIAAFYRMPILKPLAWLMSLNLFLGSFRSVQTVLLTRDLNFRSQMKVTVAATVISGIVGILLAWRGWGVWSLAIQTLVSTVVSLVLLWVRTPWRPNHGFQFASIRSLSKFGTYMALSSLLDTMYTRLNTLVIGRVYSAVDLGIYSRADNIQQIPAGTISTLLGRIAFPVFAAAATGNTMALREAASHSLKIVMFINTPIMFGISSTASQLVEVVFGKQWLPCVPLLQILCLAGVLWPLHVINLNLIKSRGRSDLFFGMEVAKKVIGLVLVLSAATISVAAMAWAQLTTAFLCYFVNSFYSGHLACYPIREQLKDMAPYFGVSLLMATVAWSIGFRSPVSAGLLLGTKLIVGVLGYLLTCHFLKLSAMQIVNVQLRQLFNRK